MNHGHKTQTDCSEVEGFGLTGDLDFKMLNISHGITDLPSHTLGISVMRSRNMFLK